MLRFRHLIVFSFLVGIFTQGQEIDSTENYIFRMAHRNGSNGGCILVQEGGAFHFERIHGKAVEVSQGTLSPDHLASLNDLLRSSQFRELLPEAVCTALLPSGLDEVVISVPEGKQWMSLRFLTELSGDRSRPLLENFLNWERRALKTSRRNHHDASSRNNCLPSGQIELKARPAPDAAK